MTREELYAQVPHDQLEKWAVAGGLIPGLDSAQASPLALLVHLLAEAVAARKPGPWRVTVGHETAQDLTGSIRAAGFETSDPPLVGFMGVILGCRAFVDPETPHRMVLELDADRVAERAAELDARMRAWKRSDPAVCEGCNQAFCCCPAKG